MEAPLTKKPASRGIRWLKTAFRILVIVLVIAGIGHTVVKSLDQFERHQFSWRELSPAWLLASAALYLAGSVPGWWFWHRTLCAMGQQPSALTSLRAYYIGHLGKYVPGKAMVVILRAALVRGPHVDTAVAATAVFVETLTTMAVGAIVGGALVFWNYPDQPLLLGLACLLLVGAAVPAWPPIFRRVVLLLRLHRASPQIEPALNSLRFGLMAEGWVLLALSWVLLGLSLWATLAAMPGVSPALYDLTASIPLLTTCVALAMVAGFVSMLPGGVGVREFVVMTLLAPPFGKVVAVLSAVLLRVVWLLAELGISLVLYLIRPRRVALPAEMAAAIPEARTERP